MLRQAKSWSPGFRLLTRARSLDLNFQKVAMEENSLEEGHELALKKEMKLLGSFRIDTISKKIEKCEDLLYCGLSDQVHPSTSLLSSEDLSLGGAFDPSHSSLAPSFVCHSIQFQPLLPNSVDPSQSTNHFSASSAILIHNVGIPDCNGMEVHGVQENHMPRDCTDFVTSICNPSEHFFSRNGCPSNPDSSSKEGFQVEGLSPSRRAFT